MDKRIGVGLSAARLLRLIIVFILCILSGLVFKAKAQTVTILYSFGSNPADGTGPVAGLVQGSDGNFYGTTGHGGTGTNCSSGCGTVFRMSPSGSCTSLYSFVGSPDGANPFGGLVQGRDGNFYGTTYWGGTHGLGSVFRISPTGSYTNLHSFAGLPSDGEKPFAGLVQGSDGNFYGTTIFGGPDESGIVFRIGPNGSYSNIYALTFFSYEPEAALAQGSDGNFYGTTAHGAAYSQGSIFRISPSGSFTNLYSFGGNPNDGANPIASLVQGSDGNFYGTASQGGVSGNNGSVFRITPNGNFTSLHSFVTSKDGRQPNGLVQASDGNFYGTTAGGGKSTNCTSGCGIVFQISPSGSYTNLYSFGSQPGDGLGPQAGLVQGSDSNFYGTTGGGGANGYGTVFRFSVPLSAPPYPINQITGVQVANTNVVLNVVSIAGETYQLQFSSSMNPTNWVNVPGVSVTNSIGALLTLTNFGGGVEPQGFYRFAITP